MSMAGLSGLPGIGMARIESTMRRAPGRNQGWRQAGITPLAPMHRPSNSGTGRCNRKGGPEVSHLHCPSDRNASELDSARWQRPELSLTRVADSVLDEKGYDLPGTDRKGLSWEAIVFALKCTTSAPA
jgi:hypothetical protein